MFTYCTYHHQLGNHIVQRWLCLKFSQMSLYNSLYKYWWISWFLMITDDFYININYNISFLTSRYLAAGDAIKTIAYNFRIGVLTARKIILDVCTAIWDVLAPIYMPVPSEDKWKSIADEFYETWNFPNCIGTINGKHIMIQCLFNSGSLFFNY